MCCVRLVVYLSLQVLVVEPSVREQCDPVAPGGDAAVLLPYLVPGKRYAGASLGPLGGPESLFGAFCHAPYFPSSYYYLVTVVHSNSSIM